MDETGVYRRQGFGNSIALGHKPALLIVDFVNGFIDPEMFGGGNILEAAQRTVGVLERFRAEQAPIVFTRIIYAEDGSNTGVWCEKAPGLKQLTPHAKASQIVDFLTPQRGELIIDKTQASGFCETNLASLLRLQGVDTLAIVGATTSGCVRATVIDAISLNFRPVLIKDCIGDRALAPHNANLFDMEQKYANIILTDEIETVFQKTV